MSIDRRERQPTVEELLRMAMEGMQSRMWTALPGIVQKFTPSENTVTVLPYFIGSFPVANGDDVKLPMTPIEDCPIVWQGGGGMTLTFPIAAGDECLLVFSSRCIDRWWKLGGQQEAAIPRMHSLSDGFALVGLRSMPRALSPAPSTSKVQLRSDDGSTKIEVDPTAQQVVITAPGGIFSQSNTTVNGTLTVNGDIHATGTITGDTDVVFNGKSAKNHKHSGVTIGAGQTGLPV